MENEVLYRYLKGETTIAEEQQVAEWLGENSAEHQKQLDSVRFVFEGMELHGVFSQAMQRSMRLSWMQMGRYAVRIAAVVLIALGAGYVCYQQGYRSVSDQTNIVQVPAGQRMELTLTDGTHIWLNSEATIEYPAIFTRNSRHVKLSGEAMFEVKHDAKRPFVVETFASDVRVLGTKFNIDADEEHNRFSAALLEGSVLISNRLDPSQMDIVMKPNEVVNLVDGRLASSSLQDESSLCWPEGLLYVTGLSFTELMDKLEQTFAVRIVIDRETQPDMGASGGKIRVNAGIENALRVLQYAANFTYEIDQATNTVTIR